VCVCRCMGRGMLVLVRGYGLVDKAACEVCSSLVQ